MAKLTKKNIALLVISAIVILTILVFSLLNWETIVFLFKQITTGADIVKEYVEDLGILGILCISLVIIICFFFPFISSVPIQLASAVTYGLPFATVHVALSFFIASQLVFLFTRTVRIFSSKKRIEKRKALEEKIKNSKRSIYSFILLAYLLPFVPFFLIHMVAANSGMPWWKYMLITLFGPLPDIIITLWVGVKITTGATNPILSYVLLLVILACVVLSIIFKERVINFIFKPKDELKEIKENEKQ
ncbi:MAG: TVP38/TMEM64 family protein [Clostridia bacterium]|nr:TVP38/TMEM64 family protein [Clostridia bacterium]